MGKNSRRIRPPASRISPNSSTSTIAKATCSRRQSRTFRYWRIRMIPDKTAMGFFNISADPDGVLRRTMLTLPFGRSTDVNDWQMFGSLEVQAVRLYLGLPASQLTVNYGPIGVVSLDFGDKLRVRPDSTGHMQINYHGPRGSVSVSLDRGRGGRKILGRHVSRQDCVGGSVGNGNRRSAHAAVRGNQLPRSRSSRQRHRQPAESGISGARRAAGVVGLHR